MKPFSHFRPLRKSVAPSLHTDESPFAAKERRLTSLLAMIDAELERLASLGRSGPDVPRLSALREAVLNRISRVKEKKKKDEKEIQKEVRQKDK